MVNFILGLLCGVVLTLLTPWAQENILHNKATNAVTPVPASAPPPDNDWRFDKSHGTLNQPATKTR